MTPLGPPLVTYGYSGTAELYRIVHQLQHEHQATCCRYRYVYPRKVRTMLDIQEALRDALQVTRSTLEDVAQAFANAEEAVDAGSKAVQQVREAWGALENVLSILEDLYVEACKETQ